MKSIIMIRFIQKPTGEMSKPIFIGVQIPFASHPHLFIYVPFPEKNNINVIRILWVAQRVNFCDLPCFHDFGIFVIDVYYLNPLFISGKKCLVMDWSRIFHPLFVCTNLEGNFVVVQHDCVVITDAGDKRKSFKRQSCGMVNVPTGILPWTGGTLHVE